MITVQEFLTLILAVYSTGVTCVFVYLYAKYHALRGETEIPEPLIDTPKKRAPKAKRGDTKRKRKTK